MTQQLMEDEDIWEEKVDFEEMNSREERYDEDEEKPWEIEFMEGEFAANRKMVEDWGGDDEL